MSKETNKPLSVIKKATVFADKKNKTDEDRPCKATLLASSDQIIPQESIFAVSVNSAIEPLAKVPVKKPDNSGKETLTGFFQSWYCNDSQHANVPILKLSPHYQIINAAYAGLDSLGAVRFIPYDKNITAYEVKEFQQENKTVMISVGGAGGNFGFLNKPENVANFYNSLTDLYANWYAGGINFDIQQINQSNCDFIITAIKKFKIERPDAFISLTAKATYVCPDKGEVDYDQEWNSMVPIINELNEIIDRLEIRAFDYRDKYKGIAHAPVNDPEKMLEYIFNGYVKPFPLNHGIYIGDYKGMPPEKLVLGVLASNQTGLDNYVESADVKQAIINLNDQYQTIGGAMLWNANYDSTDHYSFSADIKSVLK